MPFVIYVLGLGIFAQGTSEFMLSGLLPDISRDLGVSLSSAGLLVSAFAIGMLVGAPLLAMATLKLPRRATLVGFQATFVAGHIAAALVPDFTFLLLMRFLTAMAYAGFWALAAVTAMAAVEPGRRARAISVITSGLSISTIVGVPAGTLLAQHAGWQAAFWAVAALTVLSAVPLLTAVPGERDTSARQLRLRTEVQSLAVPRLWIAYGTTALVTGSFIGIFSYLGALLEDVTGMSETLVPLVLGLYGVGALIGLTIGGRTADRAPHGTILAAMGTVTVVAAALAWSASSPWVAVPLAVLLGLSGFLANPAVQAQVFNILGETRTLGSALNTAAFNLGIAVAPWLSGLVIDAGHGLAATAWVGAAFAVAAIFSTLLGRHQARRHQRAGSHLAQPPATQPAESR
ncbi:Cmx/CmrA family chloramphenicol efflux MFS transporter [Streptomyces malaysiensis]|uniref:Cmx/CmrA family chloramphenicol efflux MFS transporter n=1 Tax=Streptomyces malaysiensis TaxID=92644 RepID=UPI002B2872A3|nr:Cmx/CmrA family chloramphenicol efflux MFS transporter [Streptomyces malaysiensis]